MDIGMTKEELIDMARQVGARPSSNPDEYFVLKITDRSLVAFAKLVAEHEREACAKICDSFQARDVGMQPAECAGAIRARGQE